MKAHGEDAWYAGSPPTGPTVSPFSCVDEDEHDGPTIGAGNRSQWLYR